ncbi:uncharacterized protein LOC134532625 isoform X3 [Bacillus rossius redtenbacheri]|uniref:uncharacterized protein LOC134532625 isoform X3 n=1 Tax=Bacillus rossius redtenbacheri TaxID=93214 RepID=UPI002FDD453A
MTDEQQFCLRWNNFQTNITSQFEALRNEELFVDVTLACEGQRLKAHKVVLSACSPYFKELFTSNPCKHPILFMRDVEFCHLRALVEFMYAGEVNVAQAQLTAFLRTAESLHIRGLTETPRPRKEERLSPALDADVFRPDGRKVEEEGVLDASPPLSPPPSKRPCRSATPPPLQLPCRGESPDIIEPKLELPDYGSDGECRVDGSMSASMFGLDNSIDGNTSLSSLHGSMDTYPGTSSQNFMADFSQDSSQGGWRRDSNLDPLAAGFAQAAQGGLVRLWEGVDVCAEQLLAINWCDYKKLTRGLASLLFSPMELATKSVTGQRWARAGAQSQRPTKPALDGRKVQAIIAHVTSRFPSITASMIKQILAYKCKDSALSLRYRGPAGLERQRGGVGMAGCFQPQPPRQGER